MADFTGRAATDLARPLAAVGGTPSPAPIERCGCEDGDGTSHPLRTTPAHATCSTAVPMRSCEPPAAVLMPTLAAAPAPPSKDRSCQGGVAASSRPSAPPLPPRKEVPWNWNLTRLSRYPPRRRRDRLCRAGWRAGEVGQVGVERRHRIWEAWLVYVTPVFPKKTKCKPICMPGSIFMHIVDISE
jgi:hypothetical protein